MTPVNYDAWQQLLTNNANGYGMFFVLIAALTVIGIALMKHFHPESNVRVSIRMIAVLGFFVLLSRTSSFQIAVIVIFASIALLYARIKIPISDYVLLAIIAAAVRVPSLVTEQFWYDETFTAALAQLNLRDLITVIMSDVHPPGWYLLEWGIVRTLGTSEWALRLPAFVAGIGIVLVMYRLCLSLKLKRNVALITGLILVALPGQIYYSAEARVYSLMALVVVVAMLAIVGRRIKVFAAMIALLPMLHALGYIYAVVLGAAAFVYHKRKSWAVGSLPSALVGGAWLPFLLQQASDVTDGFWLVWSPTSSLWLFTRSLVGWQVQDATQVLVYGIIIGFNIIAFYVSRRWIMTKRGVLWLVIVSLPPISAAVINASGIPVFLDRAFLGSMTLFIIPWAYTLDNVHSGDLFATKLIIVPVLVLCMGIEILTQTRAPMDDYIADACRNTAMIYNTSVSMTFISSYYNNGLPVVIWNKANDLNQTLPDEAKAALGWEQVSYPPEGRVCVLDFDTYLSSLDARNHLNDILTTETLISSRDFVENSLGTFTIHVVEVSHDG